MVVKCDTLCGDEEDDSQATLEDMFTYFKNEGMNLQITTEPKKDVTVHAFFNSRESLLLESKGVSVLEALKSMKIINENQKQQD